MDTSIIFLALWAVFFIMELAAIAPRIRSAIMLVLIIVAVIYLVMK